jgi:hypothetical protein
MRIGAYINIILRIASKNISNLYAAAGEHRGVINIA